MKRVFGIVVTGIATVVFRIYKFRTRTIRASPAGRRSMGAMRYHGTSDWR